MFRNVLGNRQLLGRNILFDLNQFVRRFIAVAFLFQRCHCQSERFAFGEGQRAFCQSKRGRFVGSRFGRQLSLELGQFSFSSLNQLGNLGNTRCATIRLRFPFLVCLLFCRQSIATLREFLFQICDGGVRRRRHNGWCRFRQAIAGRFLIGRLGRRGGELAVVTIDVDRGLLGAVQMLRRLLVKLARFFLELFIQFRQLVQL